MLQPENQIWQSLFCAIYVLEKEISRILEAKEKNPID